MPRASGLRVLLGTRASRRAQLLEGAVRRESAAAFLVPRGAGERARLDFTLRVASFHAVGVAGWSGPAAPEAPDPVVLMLFAPAAGWAPPAGALHWYQGAAGERTHPYVRVRDVGPIPIEPLPLAEWSWPVEEEVRRACGGGERAPRFFRKAGDAVPLEMPAAAGDVCRRLAAMAAPALFPPARVPARAAGGA